MEIYAPGKITRDIGLRFPNIPGFASNVIKRDVNNANSNAHQITTTSTTNLPNNSSQPQVTTNPPTSTSSSYNITGHGTTTQSSTNISAMTTNLNQITLSTSQSFSQQYGSGSCIGNSNTIGVAPTTITSSEPKDTPIKSTSPTTTKTNNGNDINTSKKLSTINPSLK